MFERVYGHDRIKSIMERMITKDALHHGLCFHGPAGIGKRLLAREVARAMLCEKGTGCGQCKACSKFASDNHPDYVEPEGADIKVGQIREISDNLHYRPFEGRARIYVLDRVETFREEAANAFLKSLEEPPEYVYFILVCSDLKALLPTIRSRCQKIAFQPLKPEDKTEILKNSFGKDETMAKRLAGISFRQLETEDEAWETFHKDIIRVITWLNLMVDEGHGLDYLSESVRDKTTFPRFLDHLTAILRELTLTSFQLPGQNIFDDFRGDLTRLALRRTKTQWREFWEKIVRLNGDRRRNLNLPLWFNAASIGDLGLLDDAARSQKMRMNR